MMLSVLEAPICAGSPTDGSQFAYRALAPGIRALFGDAASFLPMSPVLTEPSPENLHALQEVMAVSRTLFPCVRDAVLNGDFPLTVGGDHSVAMGSVAGAAEAVGAEKLCVIYIDGHTDINTEQSSLTGFLHGMPLAQALGLCGDALDVGTQKKHLYGKNLFIVGARSIDAGEFPILRKSGAHLYPASDVRNFGIKRVMEQIITSIPAEMRVHISFDVDCMDGAVFPATGYIMPDGLTFEEAKYALSMALSTGKAVSMDFVEYNPRLDADRTCEKMALELLSLLKSAKIS